MSFRAIHTRLSDVRFCTTLRTTMLVLTPASGVSSGSINRCQPVTVFAFLAFIEDVSVNLNLYEHAVTDAGGPAFCALGDRQLRANIHVGPMLSSFIIGCEVNDEVLNRMMQQGSSKAKEQNQRLRMGKGLGGNEGSDIGPRRARVEDKSPGAEKGPSATLAIKLTFEGKTRDFQMCRPEMGQPKKRVTLCGAPMFGSVTKENLYSWIAYHQLLGVEHFHLYPEDEHLVAMLAPLQEKGIVTIEHWKPLSEIARCANCRESCGFDRPGPLPYYTQVLAANHCLFREQSRSEWVLFIDIDEALFFPEKEITGLGDLLQTVARSSPQELSKVFMDQDGKSSVVHVDSIGAISFSNMLFSM